MQFMKQLTANFEELAKCNQEEFSRESGTKGNCIEAREIDLLLCHKVLDYEPDKFLKLLRSILNKNYGGSVSLLCTITNKTNYHIHLIFFGAKTACRIGGEDYTRNMFYDEKRKACK